MRNLDAHFAAKFSQLTDAPEGTPSDGGRSPSGSLTAVTPGSPDRSAATPVDDFHAFFNSSETHRTIHETPTEISHGNALTTDNVGLNTSPTELQAMMYRFAVLEEDKNFRRIHFDDIQPGEGMARSLSKLMLLKKDFADTYRSHLLNNLADTVLKAAAMPYTENVIENLALRYRKGQKKLLEDAALAQFMGVDVDLGPGETAREKLLEAFKERLSWLLISSKDVSLNLALLPEPELRNVALEVVVTSHSGALKEPIGPRTLRLSFKGCIGIGTKKILFNDALSSLCKLAGKQREVHLELDFSDNHLSDAALCQLMKTIRDNQLDVRALYLKNNQIWNGTAMAVAELIAQGKLEILDLEGDQLKDGLLRRGIGRQGIEALFSAIPDSNLKTLNLARSFVVNYFDEEETAARSNSEIIRFIANKLPYCKSLIHLNLADNAIDGDGFYFLGKGLQGSLIKYGENEEEIEEKLEGDTGSNYLQYLNLSKNMRTFSIGQALEPAEELLQFYPFLDALEECRHLQVLDLSELGIDDMDGAAHALGSHLPAYPSLSVLKIEHWPLSSLTAGELFKGVTASGLKTLIINALSSVEGEDVDLSKRIANMLGDAECSLVKLAVNYCGIGDDGLIGIAEKLSDNPNSALTHLDLANPPNQLSDSLQAQRNCFSDKGVTALADTISRKNSRLIHLNLDRNKVTSDSVEKLRSIMEQPLSEEKPASKLKFLSAE